MKVILSMIVKDEAHVIERCLKSVLPVIDKAVICDTGSTDGTQDLIKRLLTEAGKPWEWYDDPWVHFGHNRSLCIERACRMRECAEDYILTMDADHVWHGELPHLSADGYYVEHRYAGTVYGLACMVRAGLPWRYEGALHEIITCEQAKPFVALKSPPYVTVFHEGARSRDPDTYKKDATILRQYLVEHPNDPRTAYYLAQSLKDSGQPAEARAMYLHRAEMKGWFEERWHARYRAAQIAETLSPTTALAEYLACWQQLPTRAEPLVAAARWCRLRKEWELGAMFAERAMAIPKPKAADNHIFVEEAVYDWVVGVEFSVNAHYAGRSREALATAQKMLRGPLPDEIRTLTERNIGFFKEAA